MEPPVEGSRTRTLGEIILVLLASVLGWASGGIWGALFMFFVSTAFFVGRYDTSGYR